jgi:hypothetical protein
MARVSGFDDSVVNGEGTRRDGDDVGDDVKHKSGAFHRCQGRRAARGENGKGNSNNVPSSAHGRHLSRNGSFNLMSDDKLLQASVVFRAGGLH